MYSYKLAIIIPSWNCSMYIGEMLDSVIANTYDEWKCFVVDDLSTDNTIDIVKMMHEKDARIQFVSRYREPKGAQTCRNIGYELSEGAEYVIWFDADDLIAPYCLEQRVAYMDRHSELDFGIFPAISFKENIWEENAWCFGIPFFEDTLQAMLSWTLPMVGWTNIFRRDSLEKFGHKWDERILSMQDSDFNIQSILLGMKFEYAIKEGALVDYYYRTNQGKETISSKISSPKHLPSHLLLIDKITNSLTKEQKKRYKSCLKLYHFRFANIFRFSKECYQIYLQLPWLKENRFFLLKLKIWKALRFTHTNNLLLFRKLLYDDYLETTKWHKLMNNQYINMLENYKKNE